MDMRTPLMAGAGILLAGGATAIGTHWLRDRSSIDSLADVIFTPHDRDSSGTVALAGPVRPDDERAFAQPGRTGFDTSFVRLLQAADLLGNHDKTATRDEVIGLLHLADESGNRRLSRNEQKKLTHAAQYSENYGSFIQDKVTLREVPRSVTLHRPLSQYAVEYDEMRAGHVLSDYPAWRRQNEAQPPQ